MYTRYFNYVVETLSNFGELLNTNITLENYLSALLHQLLVLVLIIVPLVLVAIVIATPIVLIKKCDKLFSRHLWKKHVCAVEYWNEFMYELQQSVIGKTTKEVSKECLDKCFELLSKTSMPVDRTNAKAEDLRLLRDLCTKYSTYTVTDINVPEFLDNRGKYYKTFTGMFKVYTISYNFAQAVIVGTYLFILIPVVFMLRY